MGPLCYRRHRFPPEIIQHAIWLYLRFTLSYRDVEELLAERGLDISYETVRRWVLKFGPAIARRLRQRRPRRLSRSETRGRAFSCLGEFLWYLSGDNQLDFIRHYIKKYDHESEDKKTVYGGYGPRIFCQRGHNQLENVIGLLQEHPTSRRAVIQLFNAEDLGTRPRHPDIPCTCTPPQSAQSRQPPRT